MSEQLAWKFLKLKSFQQEDVEVSVRFGNPKYDDCRNFGICKMELSNESNIDTKDKIHFATAKLKIDKNKMWLCFNRSSIHPKTRSLYFRSGIFRVEKEKYIGKEICDQLNLNQFVILPKDYKIIITKKFFSIELTE